MNAMRPPPAGPRRNAMLQFVYEDPTYDARMYVERDTRPKRIGPSNPAVKYEDIQTQYEVDFPLDTNEPPDAPRRLRRKRRVLD